MWNLKVCDIKSQVSLKKKIPITIYLDKAISLIESQLEFAKWKIKQEVSLLVKRLKWLGTYIELVELVYALYASEILGNIPLKELFSVLGEVFDFNFGW
jgi:hypothetical protein